MAPAAQAPRDGLFRETLDEDMLEGIPLVRLIQNNMNKQCLGLKPNILGDLYPLVLKRVVVL